MKSYKNSLFILFCFLFAGTINAQVSQNKKWVNGFGKYFAGENLEYHSCHPEATLSLLIRCLNKKDFIEWETDSTDGKTEEVTFVWIGGFSTGTSTSNHTFKLSLNDKYLLSFTTKPKSETADWSVKENGAELFFKFGRVDQHNDFFGYFSLTIPISFLNGSRTAKIKVHGDATGSNDWYMTMQYPLVPKIRVTPEKIVVKGENGKSYQRVKVSIDHFDFPKPVVIKSLGIDSLFSNLSLGMNDYYLNIEAPKKVIEKNIEISIDGKLSFHKVDVKPAKKITFYLIPHGHVDIGYTELQTEVEKKHWQNFDNAIKYSTRSRNYDSGSVFKWNVEVLWAVKSYLEKFPEKKKDFFDAVRKGWIGLDATYANVQTALCRPEELYRLVEYSNLLEKEIGIKIESAMISDIPGYTWGTVQAFADNGIKYFSVGTNEFDRIGNTLKTWGDKPFYWQSPSGQNKILIWLAGKGYSWFHSWRLTRDDLSPLVKYLDKLDETNYPYDIVHTRYNIGGDNGYPDSTLSGFVQKWNANHETPKFKIATTKELFEDFEKKYNSEIPTFAGDFTPYWEDGAGSSAKETALNRQTAELLVQLETLYTINDSKNFPFDKFDEAWRNVLLFSEHTWGAYNSVSDPELKFVTDQWDIKKSYALKGDSIAKYLQKVLTLDNISMLKPIENFKVANTSSWLRTDIVTLPTGFYPHGKSLIDEKGNKCATQRLSNGELVFVAKDIPALGAKQYRFVDNVLAESKVEKLNELSLENKFFQVELNEKNGSVKSIKNRGEDFNYVDENNVYQLNGFVYTGRNAENTQINLKPIIEIREAGAVFNSVVVKSEAPGCNSLTSEIRVFSDLEKIEIVNVIDKKKDYAKENLRFAFPFNIKGAETKIDLAWSVIRPEKDQLAGANKNYFTGQRWLDVSNAERGITIASIDAPFWEVGGMNAEAWLSTPNKEWADKTMSSDLIYSWVMNNSWHTNFKASQEGVAVFKYAILPHKQFNYYSAYKFGVEQSQPLIPMLNRKTIMETVSPIELVDNDGIVITTLRQSRDRRGIMVRLFNPAKKISSAEIIIDKKLVKEIFYSNGDEVLINQVGSKITLKPYEAKTIKMIY